MSRDTWGAPGGPSPLVGLAFAGILFFHSCIGFALGRWLPPVVSIPLSLLVSYSWIGFTWSVDYFPLRYLAGLVMADCCSGRDRARHPGTGHRDGVQSARRVQSARHRGRSTLEW
ncbi:hypothetical protein Q9Q99_00210 [Curtobacterium flaccumfaciens]|nr:hypothetical protein Q9Q99_00210 [Curtobacterium flaccumfaciens]